MWHGHNGHQKMPQNLQVVDCNFEFYLFSLLAQPLSGSLDDWLIPLENGSEFLIISGSIFLNKFNNNKLPY